VSGNSTEAGGLPVNSIPCVSVDAEIPDSHPIWRKSKIKKRL
jgi:hypothetical protein